MKYLENDIFPEISTKENVGSILPTTDIPYIFQSD